MEFRHDSSVTEQKLESASVRRYVHDPMFIRFDRTRGFATGRRTDKRAETYNIYRSRMGSRGKKYLIDSDSQQTKTALCLIHTGRPDWSKLQFSRSVRRCELSIKANSHRHARHDKSVLSMSRPLRRCELDSRQLNSRLSQAENLKSEHVESSLPMHTRHDTDRTVLSCLVWRCKLSRPDRPISAFSVGVRRAAQALPVRPPDAL